MNVFHWSATDSFGEQQTGTMRAKSAEAVAVRLRAANLTPDEIAELVAPDSTAPHSSKRKGVAIALLAVFAIAAGIWGGTLVAVSKHALEEKTKPILRGAFGARIASARLVDRFDYSESPAVQKPHLSFQIAITLPDEETPVRRLEGVITIEDGNGMVLFTDADCKIQEKLSFSDVAWAWVEFPYNDEDAQHRRLRHAAQHRARFSPRVMVLADGRVEYYK